MRFFSFQKGRASFSDHEINIASLALDYARFLCATTKCTSIYREEDSEDFFFQQDGKEAFFNIKPSCQQIEENVGDYDENGHFVEAEEIWNHKQVEVEEDAHQQQNHEGQEEKSEAEESEASQYDDGSSSADESDSDESSDEIVPENQRAVEDVFDDEKDELEDPREENGGDVFDDENDKLKDLREENAALKKQIERLKHFASENTTLKKQIGELNAERKRLEVEAKRG